MQIYALAAAIPTWIYYSWRAHMYPHIYIASHSLTRTPDHTTACHLSLLWENPFFLNWYFSSSRSSSSFSFLCTRSGCTQFPFLSDAGLRKGALWKLRLVSMQAVRVDWQSKQFVKFTMCYTCILIQPQVISSSLSFADITSICGGVFVPGHMDQCNRFNWMFSWMSQ